MLSYFYAGTRAKARTNTLLSTVGLERLLGARDTEEQYRALHDTFLAPYLSREESAHHASAVEASVDEAKKFLTAIAPEPEMLEILWAKYDFLNLQMIVKDRRNTHPENSAFGERLYRTGTIEPGTLIAVIENDTLTRLPSHLKRACDAMQQAKTPLDISLGAQAHYFSYLTKQVKKSSSPFLKRYQAFLIDGFNLKNALRLLILGNNRPTQDFFVSGGSIPKRLLETEESILEAFTRMGNISLWNKAVEEYRSTKNMIPIERSFEDALMEFLRKESFRTFSIAPLFLYFHVIKNNAQTIRGILDAKSAGMEEAELRLILRTLYV